MFSAAVVRTMIPEWPPLATSEREQVTREVVQFVRHAFMLAPFHVRLGIGALSAALALWLKLSAPPPPASAAPSHRAALALDRFVRWSGSGAAIVRLYRSLSVLAFYEHPLVLAAMESEQPADRQQVFRAVRVETAASEGSG
jgi:hypothetical protein